MNPREALTKLKRRVEEKFSGGPLTDTYEIQLPGCTFVCIDAVNDGLVQIKLDNNPSFTKKESEFVTQWQFVNNTDPNKFTIVTIGSPKPGGRDPNALRIMTQSNDNDLARLTVQEVIAELGLEIRPMNVQRRRKLEENMRIAGSL